ncbi:VWA domain-containing protein [Gemella sp. 19428wG2_WT2a]|nr:VWA domain-containing protein [Gemella sp. 19428wG2_WT2a]
MIKRLTKLAEYLTKQGIATTESQILSILRSISDWDLDLTSSDDMAMIFALHLAKNQAQQNLLSNVIQEYFENNEKLANLEKKIAKIKEQKEAMKSPGQYRAELEKNSKKAELQKKLDDKAKEEGLPKDENELKKMKIDLEKEGRQHLANGDLAQFENVNSKLQSISEMENLMSEIKKEREFINNEMENRKIQAKELDEELEETLKEIEHIDSVDRSQDFVNKNNRAVQSLGQGSHKLSISHENLPEISKFIRENKQSFKTKFLRIVSTGERRKLMIQNTIKSACKTGGKPLHLEYEKKKRSKANLLLLLDMSDSCSASSSILLTLAHSFKEVFAGGTQAYAFVNRLYDISDLMEETRIETAIDNVFKRIPTARAYTDYQRPLRMLWEDYQSKINKDTIVIVVGDARNNRLDPGEEFYRAISRRAKKMVFLNTDPKSTWDTGDSIIGVYSQYSKAFEITTLGQLEYALVNI